MAKVPNRENYFYLVTLKPNSIDSKAIFFGNLYKIIISDLAKGGLNEATKWRSFNRKKDGAKKHDR